MKYCSTQEPCKFKEIKGYKILCKCPDKCGFKYGIELNKEDLKRNN